MSSVSGLSRNAPVAANETGPVPTCMGIIRSCRIRAGLTQAVASSSVGVSASLFSRWERGEKVPSDKRVGLLGRALLMTVSERDELSRAANREREAREASYRKLDSTGRKWSDPCPGWMRDPAVLSEALDTRRRHCRYRARILRARRLLSSLGAIHSGPGKCGPAYWLTEDDRKKVAELSRSDRRVARVVSSFPLDLLESHPRAAYGSCAGVRLAARRLGIHG